MLTALIRIARPLLSSRVVRLAATSNTGIRNIASDNLTPNQTGGSGGFLGSMFGGLVKFTGWLINGALGGLAFTFTAGWSFITQSALQLYFFNWNITDQQIDQLLKAQEAILAGQLGETIGNTLGYLICGIAPSAAIMAFNEPLGAYLLAKVGEEALEEFLSNFQQLIQLTFKMGMQRYAFNRFKNMRRNVRNLVNDPNGFNARFVKGVFGSDVLKALQGWGTTNKPWSFALSVEEWIDSLNNPVLENFFEELIESFIDGCIEAGYVVAGGLDSWVMQQRLARTESPFGAETIVELTPDREADNERIILAAPRDLLRQELVSTMRTHTLIDNRDVGMVFGETITQLVKDNPTNDPTELSIKIQFYGTQKPPWRTNNKTAQRTYTTIPNIRRSKIDWEFIKTVSGGTNGYLWGRFYGVAKLANASGNVADSIRLYAATSEEAEDRLIALAQLSEYDIVAINVTEEKRFGRRASNRALYKETTRVYPAYFTIINSQKILNEENGINTLNGTYKKRDAKILLWVDKKPNDFETAIAELFKDT